MKVKPYLPWRISTVPLLIALISTVTSQETVGNGFDSAENAILNTTESSPYLTNSGPFPVSEGSFSSVCNETLDCQPYKDLQCINGHCLCAEPKLFEFHEERCVIPLGEECPSTSQDSPNLCPNFAECFMDRCVCKSGYKMFTMTRCEPETEAEKAAAAVITNQPEASSQQHVVSNNDCTPNSCDETKGLICMEDGHCRCKQPKDMFLEEFGRCLNETVVNPLRNAVNALDSDDLDLKSFVKLLERVDTSGDDNSPVHQLILMLGKEKAAQSSTQSEVTVPMEQSPSQPIANPEVNTAPQQESAIPAEAPLPQQETIANPVQNEAPAAPISPPLPPPAEPAPLPQAPVNPVVAAEAGPSNINANPPNIEPVHSDTADEEPYYLPLDKINPQTQAQEPSPAIAQREVEPSYEKHGDGIPLYGYGVIPEASKHHRVPHYGGYHHPGYGGYGGRWHGHGMGPYGFDGFHDYPYHGGHFYGHPYHHHHMMHPKAKLEEKKEEKKHVAIELGELIAKSFKIFKKFIPLIHVVDGILKKEDILKKKSDDLEGRGSELVSAASEIDESESGKKEEIFKEGAVLSGLVKLIKLLFRLKKKFDEHGGEHLKKLLKS